jgi:hypothetical protein
MKKQLTEDYIISKLLEESQSHSKNKSQILRESIYKIN